MAQKKLKKMMKRGLALGLASVLAVSTQVSAATVVPARWKTINFSTVYTSTQGMCMDDKNNVYVAKIASDKQVQIYKIDADDKEKHKVVHRVEILGHANDMTYCPENGYLYVATGGDTSMNPKYDVIAFDTKHKDSNNEYKVAGRYDIPGFKSVSGIAYDNTTGLFYMKTHSKVRVFRLGDDKKTLKKRNKIKLKLGSHTGYVHQGIAANNGKIYIPLWDKFGEENSVVRIYEISKKTNKKGKKVFTADFTTATRYDNDTKDSGMFEVEGLDFSVGGKMFMATNNENTKNDGIFVVK